MARQHVEQPSTARKPGHNQSGLNVERRTVIRPDAPDNSMRRWGRPVVKLVVVVVVMSVALLHWDGGAAFFLGLLAASVIGLIDGRLSIAVGLLAIAACPLLLIANREAWLQQSTLVNYYLSNAGLYNTGVAADVVAVWAYYFLCIGVVTQIVRSIVVRKRHEDKQRAALQG
jgi:hypothetical protein